MSASQPPLLSWPAHAAAILRSLTSLAERLRSTQPPHRMEDLRQLASELNALLAFISNATAAPALLSNAAARGALLSVLAVTLRQPLPCTQGHGGGGEGARLSWGYECVAKTACTCCDQLIRRKLPPHLAARQVNFALRLLRTQPLHCCARRLAMVGAAFLSLERAPQQAGQGPQEQPQGGAASRAAAQAQLARADQLQLPEGARFVLAESVALIAGLTHVTKQPSGEEDARPQAKLAQLQQELAVALRDSCVLEHTARMLLLLHGSSLRHPDEKGEDYRHAVLLSFTLDATAGLLSCCLAPTAAPAGEPSTLSAAVREVLSGRCSQHAVLVLGVTALCAADGGPAYGLPGELLQRVPLIGQRQGSDGELIDLRFASGRQLLDATALANMVRVLGSRDRVAPPGLQGALALLLRVVRLVVASGRTYLGGEGGGPAAAEAAVPQERGSSAGASGSGSGGEGGSGCGGRSRTSGGGLRQVAAQPVQPSLPPRLERVLRMEDLPPLFSAAMEAAMALCFPARPADRPQRAAARFDCWRLIAAYTRDVLPLRLAWPFPASPMCHLTDPGRLMPGAPLPASPPPSWEAALAGGLLPCLERLLRRGGEDPGGPELLLISLLTLEKRVKAELVWRRLSVLLAYGEPRQAAAVVATLGKLVRAADPASLAAAALTGQFPAAFAARWILAGAFAELCTDAAAAESQAGGPTQGDLPGGAPSAAGRQLARMLSYALCEWLPPLAHLSGRVMQAADDAKTAALLLHPLLLWLPVVAHRCSRAAGDDAAATAGGGGLVGGEGGSGGGLAWAEGGGGGGGSGRDDSGGWRQLLLAEVGAVQLLGAALHSFAGASPADLAPGLLPSLLRACCAIAAACPREVQAATVAVATVAASGRATATQPRFPWRPQLLRALARGLRAQGKMKGAGCAEALAAVLDVWESAGGASWFDTGEDAAVRGPPVPLAAWRRVEGACFDAATQQIALALVPVAEARAVLRTCSHPGCVSLAGDSEAEAEAGLLVCGRCGSARYCCVACQAAHWRAGHKRACVRRG